MARDFLAWANANDVPFFAIFSAAIGCGLALMFALAALLDLGAGLVAKCKRRLARAED